MTCHVREEDKLAREGSEQRRIMGLRRETLIFYSSGRCIPRLPRQREERRRDRKRHDRQIAALHASHAEKDFCTWTDKESHTFACSGEKEQSAHTVWVRNTTPRDGDGPFCCKKNI